MPNSEKQLQKEVEIKPTLVLLRITQEVIRNSGEQEIFQLRKVLKETIVDRIKKETSSEKKEVVTGLSQFIPFSQIQQTPLVYTPAPSEEKQEIKLEIEQSTKPLVKSKRREISEPKAPINARPPKMYVPQQTFSLPQIKIPEPKLPPNFEYLRPSPTNEEIDLKKLNPFLRDNFVKTIECPGSNQNVMVTGGMGRKPTAIKLSDSEIQDILKTFSIKAKIPLEKGIFKIAFGNLILSAITSEIVGSKFVIKKMENQRVQSPIRR